MKLSFLKIVIISILFFANFIVFTDSCSAYYYYNNNYYYNNSHNYKKYKHHSKKYTYRNGIRYINYTKPVKKPVSKLVTKSKPKIKPHKVAVVKVNTDKTKNTAIKTHLAANVLNSKSKDNLYLADFSFKKEHSNTNLNSKTEKEPNFLSEFLSLLFVILLIPVFFLFINKLRKVDPANLLNGKFKFNETNKFNLLSTTSLGQGKNLHLVEINGKKLVIGSTSSNISLLAELDNNDQSKQETTFEQDNIISDNDNTEIPGLSPVNYDFNDDTDLIEDEEVYYNSDTYRISRLGIYRDYLNVKGDVCCSAKV